MIVVSDASPLISLDLVGRLELLGRLFGRVVVPELVRDEVQRGQDHGLDLAAIDWIEVRPVQNGELLAELTRANLDLGESSAIILALELEADLLLVDERSARRVAQQRGIEVVGVLGVLALAKRRGLVPAVKPILDELTTRAGFRASRRLVMDVLASSGETETE